MVDPIPMPGSCDRSRKAAVARSISPSFESAVTGFFGTRDPSREEAEGSHSAYVASTEGAWDRGDRATGLG